MPSILLGLTPQTFVGCLRLSRPIHRLRGMNWGMREALSERRTPDRSDRFSLVST
jgi:hypothetical protein